MDTLDRELEAIFESPPLNREELVFRLEGLDRPALLDALAARIEADLIAEDDLPLLGELTSVLGGAPELGPRLEAVLARSEASAGQRIAVITLLGFNAEPEQMSALAGRHLDRDMMGHMLEASLRQLVEHAPDGDLAHALAEFLGQTVGPEDFEGALEMVERIRVDAGRSVAMYRVLLAEPPSGAAFDQVADLLVGDLIEETVPLLEELLGQADDPGRRRRLQKALMRCRTRAIEPHAPRVPVPGQAWITACDGQGAFIVAAAFGPPDGHATLGQVVIRAAESLRDGLHLPRLDAEEVTSILQRVHEGVMGDLIEISLEHAALLVEEAVDRTRSLGIEVPPDARPVVRLYRRVPRDPEATLPAPGAASEIDEALLDTLMAEPCYGAWFFDQGDLAGAGVSLPQSVPPEATWCAEAAQDLATEELRGRLEGMVRHMARVHAWSDEPEAAALMSALLIRLKAGEFADLPLVQRMVARGPWPENYASAPEDRLHLGDPALRRSFRAEFFAEITHPTGRDIGTLDFTEVAYLVLDRLLLECGGEVRPRDPDLRLLALEVSRAYTGALFKLKRHRADSSQKVRRTLKGLIDTHTRADADTRVWLAEELTLALDGARAELCGACEVQCLKRPDDPCREVFFTDEHPAMAGQYEAGPLGPDPAHMMEMLINAVQEELLASGVDLDSPEAQQAMTDLLQEWMHYGVPEDVMARTGGLIIEPPDEPSKR